MCVLLFFGKLKPNIVDQRQKSYEVSNRKLIDTNSVILTNVGSLEQENSLAGITRQFLSSARMETSSAIGRLSNIRFSIDGDFERKIKVHATSTHHDGNSFEQISFEQTVSAPPQTVRVASHSKVQVTNNFYSKDATIVHLIDVEFDASTHFTIITRSIADGRTGGIVQHIDFRREKDRIWMMDFIAAQSEPELIAPLYKNSVHIALEGEIFVLKNIEVTLKTKEYHTEVVITDQKLTIEMN